MEKQLNQIQVFETQFQARDTDVPKLIARAEEGERLWSKIEEREKKFESKELTIASLRAENAALVAEKEELQANLDEQKKCMGELNLKLSGTGDKIHVFKFETLEEKKEWDALLKKASEKVIKWSGEAGALRKAKNLMTQASDMVMGTFSKTFQKKVKSEKKGAQKDFTKSIKETMKSMNPFANK